MFRWRSKPVAEASTTMMATEADIRAAYRILLGREADVQGLHDHLRWVALEAPTPTQLAERLMSSDEYRANAVHGGHWVPVDMDGYFVFARPADRLIGAGVIASRNYETHVIERFARALHSGAYVLDIGANIGLYTMNAAAMVGARGRVVAVEPLAQNQRALYAGIVKNGFTNVQVLPFAASANSGLTTVICAPDSSNGIVGVHAGSRSEESLVPTHRLDDVLATMSRLDVVKIDIEGHEPVAWSGMISLLERHRPSVFSEFSPIAMRNVGQDAEHYLRLLFAYASTVTVLHRDADAVDCANAAAVMDEWRQANQRANLGGEMHLDLFLAGQSTEREKRR